MAVRHAAILVLALLCTQGVVAQTVYRCGSDGRHYEQEPCGQGRAVNAADQRSASQVAQAREVALREARLADELQRQRLQAERKAGRPAAASLSAAPKPHREAATCTDDAPCPRDKSRQRHRKRPAPTVVRVPEGR
jgi:hypothetical protein